MCILFRCLPIGCTTLRRYFLRIYQETHHEIRIPERDVMHIVLSAYLLTLIHRYALNWKQSHKA